MKSEWPEVRLEDVTTKLGDGLHGTPKYDENGDYYFINGNNLGNGKITIDEKTKRASKAEYLRHKKELNDRTILVSINGTIGNVGLYNGEKVFLGKSACYFNVKDDVDKHFIRYVVTSKLFQDYINSLATGSTIKNVSLKLMRNFRFRLPPLNIQRYIAKNLKDLDDKIELNRQTNQTLEQIAQAIFKSWFVDFEPTRAKIAAKEEWARRATAMDGGSDENAGAIFVEQAAMCAISSKSLDELEQLDSEQIEQLKTTAALFPDALIESELGEIPEGWGVKTINDLSTTVAMGPFGSNIKVETFVDAGVPIINGQQLKGTILTDGDNRFITYEHANKLSKSNVFRGDIVITHRGTLGQVSIIPEESKYERYIASQSQCFIRPNKDVVSPLFLIFYFKSRIGQHELLAHKSQVGVPSIAKPVTNLRKIELVAPGKDISNRFQDVVNSLQAGISKNTDETFSLEHIRDTLLPKLLSGEMTTPQEQPHV